MSDDYKLFALDGFQDHNILIFTFCSWPGCQQMNASHLRANNVRWRCALNVLWSLAKFLQFPLISLKWDDTWRLNQILKKIYTLTKTKILKMYLFFLKKTGREKFSCNWHKLLFDRNYWRDSNIFLCVIFVKTTLKHSSLFYKIMCGI